jgi:hypothetical protein
MLCVEVTVLLFLEDHIRHTNARCALERKVLNVKPVFTQAKTGFKRVTRVILVIKTR